MGDIHHRLHQQQQQEQQQKLMSEIPRPSPIFSHTHPYNNYQQPHQIFPQLQNLPATQEFFHNYQPHFQAFLQQQQYQEQQRRLLQDQQCAVVSQENSFHTSIAGIPIDFKADLGKSSRKDGVLSGDEGVLVRGSEQYVPETRRTALAMSHCWQNQEDSAIRQPFWKHFCTDISERRNKSGIEAKDKEEQTEMNQNKDYNGYEEETDQQNSSLEASKSRLFGELEAICGHAAAIGKSNQIGPGSSFNHLNANAMDLAVARFGNDRGGSEGSAGDAEEEPSSRVVQKMKKRKKTRDEMGSMAQFFERLVKQLIDHQEVLYKKFAEMIERIDKERKEREEAWRRQELEKLQLEVAAKAHDRALASSREASIVAYLEKITGQSIKLPSREAPMESQPEISAGNVNELSTSNRNRNLDPHVMSKRWPKAEVEALIQIRSKLESRFQEPGLKGPLWEEISNLMSSMGFQRSAKRCKEKWENINKYFKKSKENPKERRQKLKTCEYFDQLDQLYSKSIISGCYGCRSSTDHQLLHSDEGAAQERSERELPSNNQETPDITQVELMKNPFMDFEGSSFEKFEAFQQEIHTKETDRHEADEQRGQVEEEEEEGEEDNEGELGEELD